MNRPLSAKGRLGGVISIEEEQDVPSHMTAPQKLVRFQVEEIASLSLALVLTDSAYSIGVRLPIEVCGLFPL